MKPNTRHAILRTASTVISRRQQLSKNDVFHERNTFESADYHLARRMTRKGRHLCPGACSVLNFSLIHRHQLSITKLASSVRKKKTDKR